MGQLGIIVVYVVALGALMYFFAIKPQKKQQKEQQQLMDSMEIGDYVLTTSGFYGVILDITEDDVIVEFGNNKNCRNAEESNCSGRKASFIRRIIRENNKSELKDLASSAGKWCWKLFV